MAKNIDNIRSYGDEKSGVWIAPKGSTLPTDFAALDAAFKELGWLSEDGIDEEHTSDKSEFKAYQGGTVVKVKRTSAGFKVTCNALEENEVVRGLVHRGQTPTVAAGVTRYNRKGLTASDDRAVVVDYYDGGVRKRAVIASADIALMGSVSHKNDDLTIHTFEIQEQGDGGYTLYGASV